MKNSIRTILFALLLLSLGHAAFADFQTIDPTQPNTFSGATSFTTTATTTFTGPISIASWIVGTSTTVCISPNVCQFQVPVGGVGADGAFQGAEKFVENEGGGTVNVKNGIYIFTNPVTISGDGVQFIGESMSGTQILVPNNFNNYVFKVNDAALRQRLYFSNFTIQGNRSNQTSGGCIMASSTARSTFTNLWLDSCYGEGIKLAGLSTGSFGYNNTVSNNYIANDQYGIVTFQNDENQIFGNTINSFITQGIWDQQGLNDIYGNTFTGVLYNTGVAIKEFFTVNSQIHDNTFDTVPQEAIWLLCNSTQGQMQVKNNYFYKTSNAGGGDPVILDDGCTGNQISGNYVTSNSSNPYFYKEVNNAATNTYFNNNTVSATSTAFSFIGANASTTSFFNNATTTPPNGIYWGQVDATGELGFNSPTGYGAYFAINGVQKLTMAASGFVGVSSSTPWGLLSVNANALGSGVPEFAVGSTTKTDLLVDGSGNVAIGNSKANLGAYSGTTLTIGGPNTNPANEEFYRNTSSGSSNIGGFTFADISNSVLGRLYGISGTSGSMGSLAFSTSNGSSLLEAMRITQAQQVGIGTTTPTAALVTVAASTTAATTPTAYTGIVSIIAGLENTTVKLFQEIDQWGHVITQGDAPTITGGTSSVSGNDRNGTITVTGTALTSVTLTFAHPYNAAPDCTESDNSTALTADITSISATQVVFGFSVGVNSGTVWYICQQHQ